MNNEHNVIDAELTFVQRCRSAMTSLKHPIQHNDFQLSMCEARKLARQSRGMLGQALNNSSHLSDALRNDIAALGEQYNDLMQKITDYSDQAEREL